MKGGDRREYYYNHIEEAKEYARNYGRTHREEINERRRNHRAENIEQVNAKKNGWPALYVMIMKFNVRITRDTHKQQSIWRT